MINNGVIVISDTLKNIKKQYIGNTYELDTNGNEEILKSLERKDYVQNTWIKEEDGKIEIMPRDAEKLKQEIPNVILENKAILYSFHIPEISLQDIFMEVYVEKGDK